MKAKIEKSIEERTKQKTISKTKGRTIAEDRWERKKYSLECDNDIIKDTITCDNGTIKYIIK